MVTKKPYEGKIRVLDRLADLIPPLDREQLETLEQSLVAEGRAHNPLWLWGDVLVDGHHRYRICQRLGLTYSIAQVYESAETIEDVEYCLKRGVIGQRNLPPTLTAKFRAEMVEHRRRRGEKASDAVKHVAKETDVSERQIYRDVERKKLVDAIVPAAKPAAEKMSLPKLKSLATMSQTEQRKAARKAKNDEKKIAEETNDPAELAKKVRSLANQYRDKLARAVADYHQHVPNRAERDRLIKRVQEIKLWK